MDVGNGWEAGCAWQDYCHGYNDLRRHGCRSWQPELVEHITVSTSTTWTAHVLESLNDGLGSVKR